MVVSGQPKTTAEYIQATSRVGRTPSGPGRRRVNWIRPRDTSHYERFRHYHDTFYRHVEATSVTPFSARARDRALPAVLTSYVRLDTNDLVREADAAAFDAANPSAARISDTALKRAFDSTNREDVRQDTAQQLANLRTEWSDEAADEDHPLVYTHQGIGEDSSRRNLMKPMEQEKAGVVGRSPVAARGRGRDRTSSLSSRRAAPDADPRRKSPSQPGRDAAWPRVAGRSAEPLDDRAHG